MSRKTALVAQRLGCEWRSTARRVFGRCAALAVALTLVVTVTMPVGAQPPENPFDGVLPLESLQTPTDDLIRIAESYTDALRDLKIAKLNIETVQRLRPNAVVTNLEVQIAMLNLEAAQRKLNVLRAIAEKQLSAAEDKLEVMKYLDSLGVSEGQAARLPNGKNFARAQDEATIRILKMILAMD